MQFLVEAVALSSFGGLIGIIVALGASLGLARLLKLLEALRQVIMHR